MTDKLTHVKWIGPHEPMVRILRNNARLYLTKKELVSLKNEITAFIELYGESFTDAQIDLETPPEDYDKINGNWK